MISAHSAHSHVGAWWVLYLPPLAGITIAAAAYAAGLLRLGRANRAAALPARRVISFFAGLFSLSLALLPPLDRLAEALFSAHMVQHLVVVLIASPLLVYGEPSLPFLLAAPRGIRRRLARMMRNSNARRSAAWLSGGLAAGLLHAVVLWAWHLPGPYQAAIENRAVHVAEHLSFFATALLFWRLVIGSGARRRLGYLPASLLVLATALQSTALGAILSFATYVLYPVHLPGAAARGVSALADQQLAGAIMWIPAGAVYLATIVVLVVRAFADVERRMLRREQGLSRPKVGAGRPG